MNRVPMTMLDWIDRLHEFLTMTGRELLTHAGTISHEAALKKAHEAYEHFQQKQLAEPTEVEKHFIQAEKELKQLERSRKAEKKKSSPSRNDDGVV
jgi:hypothetical protein